MSTLQLAPPAAAPGAETVAATGLDGSPVAPEGDGTFVLALDVATQTAAPETPTAAAGPLIGELPQTPVADADGTSKTLAGAIMALATGGAPAASAGQGAPAPTAPTGGQVGGHAMPAQATQAIVATLPASGLPAAAKAATALAAVVAGESPAIGRNGAAGARGQGASASAKQGGVVTFALTPVAADTGASAPGEQAARPQATAGVTGQAGAPAQAQGGGVAAIPAGATGSGQGMAATAAGAVQDAQARPGEGTSPASAQGNGVAARAPRRSRSCSSTTCTPPGVPPRPRRGSAPSSGTASTWRCARAVGS